MLKVQSTITEKVIKQLWSIYKSKVGQVKTIEQAIRKMGDTWSEDHIAFRTLPGKNCNMKVLSSIFEMLGYTHAGNYDFPEKKLKAISMNPPVKKNAHSSKVFPKVFISELILDSFSKSFKECVLKYTNDVTDSPIEKLKIQLSQIKEDNKKVSRFANEVALFLGSGAMWRIPKYQDYELLRIESEYAAWTLVFGNTPNHFTVSVHLMETFKNLQQFNDYVQKKLKIEMNKSGGSIIKGSKAVRLEQSATLAEENIVRFQDGFYNIPYAFVEFAFRHPLQGKKHDELWESYYQGFVTDNADKIFESTNKRTG